MKTVLFFLCAIMLMSCGHFHDDPKVSVYAGGLWLVPLLFGLGAAICWGVGIHRWNSGSLVDKRSAFGGKIETSSQKVPFLSIVQIKWAIGLTVVLIGAIILINVAR